MRTPLALPLIGLLLAGLSACGKKATPDLPPQTDVPVAPCASTAQCDDGNLMDGDGCSSICTIEGGYTCFMVPGPPHYHRQYCKPICGDGYMVGSEQCDDGDQHSGDGCSCAGVERGWTCAGQPSACIIPCGDGIVVGQEACDDGGVAPGDGCDATCATERGWRCAGEPSVCIIPCGDGIVAGLEECDDGSDSGGDGCSATCTVEVGWTCDSASPTTCTPACGDGLVRGRETCDDGGLAPWDGCSATCTLELGWGCSGEPSVCAPVCGDGVRAGPERCDDGNRADGDGCSSTCGVEDGWLCAGAGPQGCAPVCGDGLVRGTEACDDGNLVSGDGCGTGCAWETVAEIEPNGTPAEADTNAARDPRLLVDGSRNLVGSIAGAGDVDIYRLAVSDAGTAVHLETFDASGSDCRTATPYAMTAHSLRLLDSSGAELVSDAESAGGPTSTTSQSGIGPCAALSYLLDPGTFYVQVDRTDVLPAYFLRVVFQMPAGAELEPNDASTQATPLTGRNVQVSGSHQVAADLDWYVVTVAPGGSLRAEIIEGAPTERCESGGIDSTLELFDEAGTQLGTAAAAADAGRGACSLIDGTGSSPAHPFAHALGGGLYRLRVGSSAAGAAAEFEYRLIVNVAP